MFGLGVAVGLFIMAVAATFFFYVSGRL